MKVFFTSLLLLLIGLSFAQNGNLKDISINYSPGNTKIHPEFFIYHSSDTCSVVFVRIDLKEINKELITSNKFTLSYSFSLYNIKDFSIISKQINVYNYELTNKRWLTDDINLKIPWEYDCLLEIVIRNIKGREMARKYIPVKKSNHYNRNNFLLVNKADSSVILNNFINKATSALGYAYSGIDMVKTSFSKTNSNAAIAPQYSLELNNSISLHDSIIPINIINNEFNIDFDSLGRYTFFNDSSNANYFSIFLADTCFPEQNTALSMLEPLFYLNNNMNIDSLKHTAVGSKVELDKFWFHVSEKKTDKAKELIRVFYNRVELSNDYFSCNKEGWKTDRGMIFILFGLPTKAYLKSDTEVWVYQNRFSKKHDLQFEFQQNSDNQYNNDYLLNRDQKFRKYWKIAQSEWLKGKIFDYYNFNFENIR